MAGWIAVSVMGFFLAVFMGTVCYLQFIHTKRINLLSESLYSAINRSEGQALATHCMFTAMGVTEEQRAEAVRLAEVEVEFHKLTHDCKEEGK